MDSFTHDEVRLLSDIIYAAHADPASTEAGAELLSLLPRLIPADAFAAIFFDLKTGLPNGYVNQGFDPRMYREYQDHYHTHDTDILRLLLKGVRVWRPDDEIPKSVWHRSEMYNDYLLRWGFEHFITVALGSGTLMPAWFRVARNTGEEPFSRKDVQILQILQPHFTKAFRRAELFGEVTAIDRNVRASFDRTAKPLFVFNDTNLLVYMNLPAQKLWEEAGAAQELRVCVREAVAHLAMVAEAPLAGTTNGMLIARGPAGRKYRVDAFTIRPTDSNRYHVVAAEEIIDQLALVVSDCVEKNGLSPREAEICLLLARGMTNRDIADQLFITEFTVKDHVKSILGKLCVARRTEIASRLLAGLSTGT